jgi:RNA polymerase sigma-70 factor (ECF subfamily)
MKELSKEMLVRAADGDVSSFESIYKTYSGFVFNVAIRMTNHQHNAEEITQEVFLTIYRKLKSFAFESSFKTWVYRITVNSAINYMKKISAERQKINHSKNELTEREGADQIGKMMNQKYQEKIISSMLASLNPDQRICIILRNLKGLSYEEIAKTLKININTVRSRLKRARDTLLALKKEGDLGEL